MFGYLYTCMAALIIGLQYFERQDTKKQGGDFLTGVAINVPTCLRHNGVILAGGLIDLNYGVTALLNTPPRAQPLGAPGDTVGQPRQT
jgi:hypothetical protein